MNKLITLLMICMIGCSAPTLHGTKTECYKKVWFNSPTSQNLLLCEKDNEATKCYLCPKCNEFINKPVIIIKESK